MSTRQHSIDLMPPVLRARSQAGLRLGQLTVFTVVSMMITIVLATHSKLAVSAAQDRLFEAAGQAEQVFATEARAAELSHELAAIQSYNKLYERLSYPLQVGDVISTIVNLLPPSVTIDQLDLDAGARTLGLTARSRGVEKAAETPPRLLTGELSGFAENDQRIAELVTALESTPPFSNVSIDFSRGRRVNERDAREFRLSFRIDLDRRYHVTHIDDQTSEAAIAAGATEVHDEQR